MPEPRTVRMRSIRRRVAAALTLVVLPGVLGLVAAADPVGTTRWMSRAQLRAEGARPVEGGDLLLQRSLSDCGPVALHNLLRLLGVRSPGPEALAEMSGTSARGTSLGGLVRAARTLGVPLRARRIDLDDLTDDDLPLLAWLRRGHFVTVLHRTESGGLAVHDPAAGAFRIPRRALHRRWGGVVADLEAARPAPFDPEPPLGSGILSPSHRRYR